MVSQVQTVAFQGLVVKSVMVQVQISSGLPAFHIVGLPDKAVAESKERVRAAFTALGLDFPPERITVNLSPADLQKEGSHYDLPIALGLFRSLGLVSQETLSRYIALGELGLDGGLAPVNGTLAAALEALSQDKGLICPVHSGAEAAWAKGLDILAPAHLTQLLNHFRGTQYLSAPNPVCEAETPALDDGSEDWSDIKGQETAKRALEIAAAGGHNLRMIGPPGAGKTMLASRFSTILPALTPEEALSVTMIHSIAGRLQKGRLMRQRPFRAPHHSASLPSLVGGGMNAKPGEISLAHRGVLFLDELPEFSRQSLEALRQPLESGMVTISRVNARADYPARFQLICAMNPCRCGKAEDPENTCRRQPYCFQEYESRLSGPLLDRIDLHIHLQALNLKVLQQQQTGESSKTVRERVIAARQRQAARLTTQNLPMISNAELSPQVLQEISQLHPAANQLLMQLAEKKKLSARAYHRVLKVARTIADLEGTCDIGTHHVSEAMAYRG